MGIEPTGRPVKDVPTHFEDGGGHQFRACFHIGLSSRPLRSCVLRLDQLLGLIGPDAASYAALRRCRFAPKVPERHPEVTSDALRVLDLLERGLDVVAAGSAPSGVVLTIVDGATG